MLVLIKYYVQPRLCSVFGKCLRENSEIFTFHAKNERSQSKA